MGLNPEWQGLDGETPVDGWKVASDFVAGWGDGLSFGLTALARKGLGVDDAVNTDSGAYMAGTVLSMFHSAAIGFAGGAVRGGAMLGARAGALGRAGRAIGKGGCFTAGTDVAMADGTTEDIEAVEAGDEVATWDPATGERTVGKVARTFVLEADGVCVLRFADGDVIEATAEHPFFVPGRGWIYAAGLKTGDRVKSTFASSAVVSVTYRAGATKVYNFEVARTHTYYVGAGKLVHNRCIHGHHWIPRQISVMYFLRHGKWSRAFDNRVPLTDDLHRYLHSGKGFGKGGHYNDWWRNKIREKGGIGKVTVEDLEGWSNELEGLFW
jgi:hypothetical protein